MNFLKYIFISILIALSLSLFSSCEEEKEYKKTENIQVIPHNAAVIIEGRKLAKTKEIVEEQQFGKLFNSNTNFNSFFSDLNKVDIKLKQKGNSFWKNIDYSFSMHPSGAKKFSQLLIFEDSKRGLIETLKTAFIKEEYSEKEYDYQTIYSFNKMNLFVVQIEKFLVFSNKEILLKDAIRQYSAEADLPSDAEFQKVFKSANRSEMLNIYVQTNKLYEIFEMIYGKSFTILKDFNQWISLDLDIQKDNLFLTGVSTTTPDDPFYFLMKNKTSQKSTVEEVLPSSTKFFVNKLFPEFSTFLQSRLHILERELKFEQYKTYRKANKIKEDNIAKSIDNQFTYAVCGTEVNDVNSLAVIKLKNTDAFELFKTSEFNDYRGLPIHVLKDKELLMYYFGDLFKDFKAPKVLLLSNYMLISDSESLLKTVVNDYKSENSLINQKSYLDVKKNTKSTSNLMVYVSNDALELFPKQLATEKNKNQQEQVGKQLSNLGNIITQVDVEDNYLQIAMVSKSPKSEKVIETLKSAWSLELDQPFTKAPSKVWNHKTKKYDIVIQDISNQLYWINHNGKIEWSISLPEKILGEIQQIDIYKNGRKQLLFNTKSSLYLIDKNGENVDGYPVELPSEAQNGLGLFDYEKNKNYRIFIPCKHHLAVYDRLGKPVKGWKSYKQPKAIVSVPQYFNLNNKDYILVTNSDDKILIYNRQGNIRVKVEESLKAIKNSNWILKNNVFKNYGSTNEIQIDLNGKIGTTTHEIEDIIQVIQNNKNSYALTKNNLKQIKGFEFEFDNELYKPLWDMDTKSGFIAVCNPTTEELFVFDEYGKLKDHFPIFGTTKPLITSMNNANKKYVFVGGKDGTLYCYSVQ